ncbi:MAG: hypothetical protein WCA30_14915 [Dermatophilaceae bacterium]
MAVFGVEQIPGVNHHRGRANPRASAVSSISMTLTTNVEAESPMSFRGSQQPRRVLGARALWNHKKLNVQPVGRPFASPAAFSFAVLAGSSSRP